MATHDRNPEPLGRFFQESRTELLRFFRQRVHCQQTALDLCQEAFLRVAASAGFERAENPRAYLFKTARHLVLNHCRDLRIRDARLDQLAGLYGGKMDHPSAETAALAQEALEQVDTALRALSPLCQRIFHLSRVRGLTQAAIAKHLGISRRTVEDNLRRALLHCSRAIADD